MGNRALTKYEAKQLERIQAWKSEEPGVVSKAVGVVMSPLAWAIQKVIPASSIRGALDFSRTAARYVTDADDLLRDAGVSSIAALHDLELETLDTLSDGVHDWAIGIAAAEGGATGAAGLPGMAADIPLVITLALRTVHKIGLCYGYESNDEVDAQFWQRLALIR